jgi:hypothetical protein
VVAERAGTQVPESQVPPPPAARRFSGHLWIWIPAGVLLVSSIGLAALRSITETDPTANSAGGTNGSHPPSASPSLTPATELGFEAALWPHVSDERIQAQLLDGCLDPNAACRDLILELGGSEAAADFYERTNTFLVALYPAGPVQVAFVSGPLAPTTCQARSSWVANHRS